MSADQRKRRTLQIAGREIALILGLGALVLVVLGLVVGVASRSAAQQQALGESERVTRALADMVVAPLLPAQLDGRPGSTEALDRALGHGLAQGALLDLTVWQEDGLVVYSTTPSSHRQRFALPPEVARALGGTPSSAVDANDGPPAPAGSRPSPVPTGRGFIRAHVPLTPPGGRPLAVAAAYDDRAVGAIRGELVHRFLPLVLVALVLLLVVQLLSTLSLANRLRRKEEERAQLFSRALDVSDRERSRFAADLHDGPIQDLAGVGYALAALAPTVPAPQAPLMHRIQDAVGRSVDSLRSLMTDLYPPDLHSGTLSQALDTLAEPLRQSGVGVEIDLARMPELERESAVTLYRVTREVLANVEKHARASHVSITATPAPQTEPGAGQRVRLVVTDDGVGADPRRLDRRREGHLGLRIVIDRVHAAGGELTLTSSPGRGTRVEMELPTTA